MEENIINKNKNQKTKTTPNKNHTHESTQQQTQTPTSTKLTQISTPTPTHTETPTQVKEQITTHKEHTPEEDEAMMDAPSGDGVSVFQKETDALSCSMENIHLSTTHGGVVHQGVGVVAEPKPADIPVASCSSQPHKEENISNESLKNIRSSGAVIRKRKRKPRRVKSCPGDVDGEKSSSSDVLGKPTFAEVLSQKASLGAGNSMNSPNVPTTRQEKPMSAKRRRSEEVTPPLASAAKKKSRKANPNRSAVQGGSLTKEIAGNELRIVIKNDSPQELTQDQISKIFHSIDVNICKTQGSLEPLGFTKTGKLGNMIDIVCANQLTVEWVKAHFIKHRPWEGACLVVIPFNALPKPYKCTVFVPFLGFDTPSEILMGIKNQNSGLQVEKWEILGARRLPKGWLLTLGVDRDSIQGLKNVQNSPFLCSQRVNFKFSKKELERAAES
jgi:hypothetical protein